MSRLRFDPTSGLDERPRIKTQTRRWVAGWNDRLLAHAGAGLFWGLADLGWAICVDLRRGQQSFALWAGGLPQALAIWRQRLPEELRDSTIGGALTVFEQRWPIITLASLLLASAAVSQIKVPQTLPRLAVATSNSAVPRLMGVQLRPSRPPTPAPAALQQQLDQLVAESGESIGVAVSEVDAGWIASVGGQELFPQQSVSKLWVALTALEAVDKGRMQLDQSVTLWPADGSVFNQPIVHQITQEGYRTTVGDLMRRALIGSDNAANDKLMGLVGGPSAVHDMLARKALSGIKLAEDEKHLQARIIGLVWSQDLSPYGAFEAARAALPREKRDAAMAAYLADPYDGARPVSIVTALAALHRGELLSKTSTAAILEAMAKATTGPRRLKGGLPSDWSIAHKTGTGQDFRGSSIGINDVGLLTAPDGRTYAVAVMMRRTEKPNDERMDFMQSVTRAVVATWAADRPKIAKAKPQDSADRG
jgi:beta-lactamase class A